MRRLMIVLAFVLLACGATTPVGADVSPSGRWMPGRTERWQWLLDHPLNLNSANDMNGGSLPEPTVYDVDGFDNPATTVAELHARGKHVICYLSGGTWENWRPDASSFPASVKGQSNGWAGEKWVDVRQMSVLGPIMAARADMCLNKGFDAIEWDNVDGYTNSTGFPLTGADQLTYNRLLAQIAHDRGMSAVLKNDVDQTAQLEPDFDFALNEQCGQYRECGTYAPFLNAGKTVLNAEYKTGMCSRTVGLNGTKFRLALDGPRTPCP